MIIKVAADTGVEYVALSFIKDASEVKQCVEQIRSTGSKAQIIAKIERPEAVADIEHIVQACDGIMVARGDLGDTIPFETLPFAQKHIVEVCVKAGKPVIVATQMMLSMVERDVPSRAEVTDVAAAVVQGATAVMLSEETAIGKHPAEVVRAMRRIVTEAQKYTTAVAPLQLV
jgi:pyruvate kinase